VPHLSWTVGETGAHVLCSLRRYPEMLAGASTGWAGLSDSQAENARLLAEIPEREPKEIADAIDVAALMFREAFASYVLIEPIRPLVDAYVLDLLERRTFRKVEFTETTDGHCRLKAPLTHELAETLPEWSRALAPIAERVAHVLGQAMAGKYVPATPLTGTSQRKAQAIVKARKSAARGAAKSTTTRQQASRRTVAPWSCPDCGGHVTNPRHVRCDPCIAADPRQTQELRGRRGAAIAARRRAQQQWEESQSETKKSDPDYFRREILPGLCKVKLVDIMRATSFSKAFASQVRAGRFTPHPSTWAALSRLVLPSRVEP
jgi:hypothetical protein